MKDILVLNNNEIFTDDDDLPIVGKRSNSRIPRNVPAGYDTCQSRTIPVNLLSAKGVKSHRRYRENQKPQVNNQHEINLSGIAISFL